MDYKITSKSSCETRFEYQGHKMVLWIIVGGTPALAFDDYSFEQRFDVLPEYKHWDGARRLFPHQKKGDGPLPESVLPNGLDDLRSFIAEYDAPRKLRANRRALLPVRSQMSTARLHDTQERCYFVAEWANKPYIAPVTLSSNYYAGRADEKIAMLPDSWQSLAGTFNPMFDDGQPTWEKVSDEVFEVLLQMVEAAHKDSR